MGNLKSYYKLFRTEEKLVAALKNQDQIALKAIYDRYSAPLYGMIVRLLDDEEAEDVLQEVFVKIWNNAGSYDPNKSKLFTWMSTIARNHAIDVYRSKSFRRSNSNISLNGYTEEINAQKKVVFNTDTIGIKDLVKVLSPDHFQILDLVYFKGYTQVEVSEMLNIPLGTIKTKIRLAIKELRKKF
ncbi:RNA polymerase sigma factor [Pedobacter metabolipauper]|uniref:RNA polymerase sigma-70 factor (ECF subfamily) n=1 Tax=Pedobacter metabolipauper TaxID=425513 RepID=A0A4R6T1S5_9SPHI|nr:sigma-70 family RNA polymerase sigma factor [Pedobacter metabolipauper]TDQ11281.1 RNA polymerase sigma-70 factor (ECF subfamily) [Pedobacter metabolipauper]